jgi:hypothetical protein
MLVFLKILLVEHLISDHFSVSILIAVVFSLILGYALLVRISMPVGALVVLPLTCPILLLQVVVERLV